MQKIRIAHLGKWLSTASLLLICAFASAENASQTVTESIEDWLKVTHPVELTPGVPFDVEIEVLKLDAPTKLGVDLNYMKQDGKFGGMLKWGGTPRDIAAPGKMVWSLKFTAKPGMSDALISVCLSPDGEWNNRTKNASSGRIKVKLDSGAASK